MKGECTFLKNLKCLGCGSELKLSVGFTGQDELSCRRELIEVNLNTVNPDNFNDTMKGYLVRALKEAGASEEDRKRIFGGLRWAIDEMTMRDARREYEKYCRGEIVFEQYGEEDTMCQR